MSSSFVTDAASLVDTAGAGPSRPTTTTTTTNNSHLAVTEQDVMYRKVRTDLETLSDERAISRIQIFLENYTKSVEHRTREMHAHKKYFSVRFPAAFARWKANFALADSLDTFVNVIELEDKTARTCIKTISEEWPVWDWKIPGDRTPLFWSTRILKEIRYIAKRTQNWGPVVARFSEAARDRLRNRNNAGGQPTDALLCTVDVLLVKAEVEKQLEQAAQQQQPHSGMPGEDEPSEASIEHGRAATGLLQDLSDEQLGFPAPDDDDDDYDIPLDLPGPPNSDTVNEDSTGQPAGLDAAPAGDTTQQQQQQPKPASSRKRKRNPDSAPDRNLRLRPVYGPLQDVIAEAEKRVARDLAVVQKLYEADDNSEAGERELARAYTLLNQGEEFLRLQRQALAAMPDEWKA